MFFVLISSFLYYFVSGYVYWIKLTTLSFRVHIKLFYYIVLYRKFLVTNANKCPLLAPPAEDLRSAQAAFESTETYVERVFSVRRELTADKSNRLTKRISRLLVNISGFIITVIEV